MQEATVTHECWLFLFMYHVSVQKRRRKSVGSLERWAKWIEGQVEEGKGREEKNIDGLGPCYLDRKKQQWLNSGKRREMYRCMYWWICLRNNVCLDGKYKIGGQFKW